MNNLKKIGLTALGTALVASSAQAASMSVSGGTSIFFGGEDNSNAGNGWSMTDQVTFTASGEMDNGFTISTSLQLDASVWDDRSITIDTGDMGKLTFSGHGSSGPVGAWDDITPSANEESWGTSIGGTVDGATNDAAMDNAFIYDYTVSDGLAIKAAYDPSKGTDLQSSTSIGVAYTGMEGLTVKAAMGENNEAADQIDLSVLGITYAMGPVTVGYQTNESDRGTGTDEDFTAYGISYAVSDELSITYGTEDFSTGEASTVDAEYSKISVAYTSGGMTITAVAAEGENISYTTAAAEDVDYWGLTAAFAF